MRLFLLLLLPAISFAQPKAGSNYVRKEVMITMRDGVRLNTVIFRPAKSSDKLPFLFTRTPYGVSNTPAPDKFPYIEDLARDGYIFVFQDIRGRYKSEGTFQMQRFTRDKSDPKAIDESTDTWDTIDWLLKNEKDNNGKVGMYGISYAGWTTVMGIVDPHPALVAVSEQASPSDMFLGDDFHHNGAFRLSYGFEYAYMEEAAKTDELFPFGEFDLYEWYLRLGSLKNVNEKYFHGKIPSWNDFAEHVNYDEFWKKQSLPYRLDSPRVQTMHVAGWWDQEDFYGPITAYATLEKQDRHNRNFLVVGPWNHGGWGRSDGRSLGRIDFGSPTSIDYRRDVQAKWFAWQLKGKGDGKFPEAYTFQTGSNTWKSYDKWPPSTTTKRRLYFHPDGRLGIDTPPTGDEAYDEYISDPAHPVPYRPRPIEQTYGPHSRWYTWLLEDQRFVDGRTDVLSWKTEVLDKDFTVTGSVFGKLFASSTGTDADWVVKLIDVYPAEYPKDATMGGYQLMVANEVFRGRFRNGFEKPEPLIPGKVESFTIDMRQANHVFKKGHRIMVQVQSTWFPIIDRNPQTFVPNIFQASEKDFIKATQRIYRDGGHASCVEVDAER